MKKNLHGPVKTSKMITKKKPGRPKGSYKKPQVSIEDAPTKKNSNYRGRKPGSKNKPKAVHKIESHEDRTYREYFYEYRISGNRAMVAIIGDTASGKEVDVFKRALTESERGFFEANLAMIDNGRRGLLYQANIVLKEAQAASPELVTVK